MPQELKTAQAYECEQYIVYECFVNCPYCGKKDAASRIGNKPEIHECLNCYQSFKIEWAKDIKPVTY